MNNYLFKCERCNKNCRWAVEHKSVMIFPGEKTNPGFIKIEMEAHLSLYTMECGHTLFNKPVEVLGEPDVENNFPID